jgi:GTP-binding protein HflX
LSELKRDQLKVSRESCVLVGVLLPDTTADPRDPLGELASLCKTAGATPVARVVQNRRAIDAGTYVGSGKATEIAELCKTHDADFVAFDNDLTPGQIGQLEKLVNTHLESPRGQGVKVLDRSEIILDIFANRAQTHEAKLQVELAQMEYTYPRLTRMWGHLERIAGGGTIGVGTRGPGETQLEIDRRLVRKRIADLKAQLVELQSRKAREVKKRNTGHFTACLVGYTNAGKSTLFNTLTAAGTYADDKLFATLDTKTRAWNLEAGARAMLSDTVGFVRDLPHDLVASFKATLEEAVHADVLLHVLDVGHPRARTQYDAVRDVLSQIGAGDNEEILLLNKVDTPEGAAVVDEWLALRPDALAVSAKTGRGLERLHDRVLRAVHGTRLRVTLKVPSTDGAALALVERLGHVRSREFDDGQAILVADIGRRLMHNLRDHEHVEVMTADEL